MKPIEPKHYADIDYEFRPKSFWAAASDPLTAILRNVKGRNRREMIRDYYAAGKLEELSDGLLKDSLDDESRQGFEGYPGRMSAGSNQKGLPDATRRCGIL
jgi:hypothetical protein